MSDFFAPKIQDMSSRQTLQISSFSQSTRLTKAFLVLNYTFILIYSFLAVIGLPIIFLNINGALNGLERILFGGDFGALGLYLSYSYLSPLIYILSPIAILSIIHLSLQLRRYSFSNKLNTIIKFGILLSAIYIIAVIIVNFNMFRNSRQKDPYYEPDSYPSEQQYYKDPYYEPDSYPSEQQYYNEFDAQYPNPEL